MKLNKLTAELAWSIVAYHVTQHGCFYSVRDKLRYNANLEGECIKFWGGNRQQGVEEIAKADFTEAFVAIAQLQTINTSSIKKLLPQNLYAKRSPFIGLLVSSKLLA